MGSGTRAGPRSFIERMLGQVLRVMAACAFALGTFGVLGAPGCGAGSDTCAGQMSSSCDSLGADLCPKVRGCHAKPGTCLPFCETPGVNCAASACVTSGSDCKSECAGAAEWVERNQTVGD